MSDSLLYDVQNLMSDYLNWLKNRTVLKQVSHEWVEIETPYLDRHNDYLSIYVRRENSYFEITDGGYIINDLKMSGCSLDKGQRAKNLRVLLLSDISLHSLSVSFGLPRINLHIYQVLM